MAKIGKKTKSVKPSSNGKISASAGKSSLVNIDDLLAAKKFAVQFGGVEKATAALTALNRLSLPLQGALVDKQNRKKKGTSGTQKISAAAGKRLITKSVSMEFISIPAGSFTMGSPKKEKDRGDDEKQVKVTITRAFELGKTVVTQKQWIEVMGTTECPWEEADEMFRDDDLYDPAPPGRPTPKGNNYPAVGISWYGATEFCAKLTALEHKSGKLSAKQTYRLPTEAEWEYACRAGTTMVYSFGDDESKLGDYAWYAENSEGSSKGFGSNLHKVATKKPNTWGLFDMHGNVWEWCEDFYEKSLSGGNDPKGPSAGSDRVVRGGGWGSSASDCRSARRDPSCSDVSLGFRIVRVLL